MLPCIQKQLDRIRDNTSYQASSLAAATAIATGLLLLVSQLTAPAIAMRQQEDQQMALALVMPSERYSNNILATAKSFRLDGRTYQLFTAFDNGVSAGYVVETEADGYAGPIKLMIGLDERLQIIGVRVLSHAETPGLGDKIEVSKHKWITSFDGLSLANTGDDKWQVKKDGGQFDQFSGATITPRAVVRQVHQTLRDMESVANQQATEQLSAAEQGASS
ncbi:electron transport complex subunit RsxG [Neiella sp. HB171785]|uniref:Ion-translocating oxidoreductase complex subunit G n=1 Tax=Neiella litorisoli TaxID=2771431 RepID=A0A8J6QSY0_9GAMM|nr:electron transport complex subunit RsxG [Neiella litorisoli]MBD1388207.1 electron transport complex subunit RsxG [Neiella litorisoli]